MADETKTATLVTAPGNRTSEFAIATAMIVVGGVLEAAALLLHTVQDAGIHSPWVTVAGLIVGALIQVASAFGYTKSRTLVKTTTATAALSSPPKP